ncbi:MAG: glycosyl transferase [Lachnospiraceae bacterium]|nr:glycosyl transferase [Lachnospiraceae bacterium]
MNGFLKDICIVCFRISAVLPDALYLRMIYRMRVRRKLNLDNPRTFTEKMQYMKLTDHNPLYKEIADKYEVRKYVSERIGEEYLTRLYGVYDKPDEIPFDKLPDKYVLKATHDSGGCIIVEDKKNINVAMVKKKLYKLMKRNFYWKGREWCYKDIAPRIICEELLEDKVNHDLYDYKFFCFHGRPRLLFVASGRKQGKPKYDFFDLNFGHLDINTDECNKRIKIKKPENYDQMVKLAELLSKEFTQVRVDFYNIGGKIYFGELTLFHMSGFERFRPHEWDVKLGEWW